MIRIIKPGLLSTVQDLGRMKYLAQAVPVSGAMDSLSATIANLAIGNPANAAVIEFTYSGAEFIAEKDMLIAVSGGGSRLKAGKQDLPSDRPLFIPSGTSLTLANTPEGCRLYLAIAGGFDVPEVLGSRSTYLMASFGGLEGRVLRKNDRLKALQNENDLNSAIYHSLQSEVIRYPDWSIAKSSFLPADQKQIRILPGRERNWFDSDSITDFLSRGFKLSGRSNRMGIFIEGCKLNRIITDELISTAVCPGTIQVSGNGTPILLMADCQTTGGYPRIAQAIAVDLPLCGQLKPGDEIRFKEISYNEAEILYLEQVKELQELTVTIHKRYGIH